MLDANEVLKELEELLDEGYLQLCERKPGRVQVYEKPMPTPAPRPPQALLVPKPKTNPLSEFVANTCLLLFLSVLSDRLANQ